MEKLLDKVGDMPSGLQAIQSTFRKYATHQVYDSAQILSRRDAKRTELLLTSTIRDLARNKKRRIVTYKSFRVTAAGAIEDDVEWSAEEREDVVMSAAHEHVEGQRIVFRACEGKTDHEKRFFVERWSQSSILESLEVTSRHGNFYADDAFGGISFHPSIASRIVYVAEAKQPENETYTKFKHEDNWGEALSEKSNPVVIVLDFAGNLKSEAPVDNVASVQDQVDDQSAINEDINGKVLVLSPPEGTACGQPVFAPGNDKVVWVATRTSPRRYGILYCINRRTSLMYSNYDGSQCRNLTENYEHARSPRFGQNENLYFLTNASGGPHFYCSQINCYNLQNGKSHVVVPEVYEADNGEFAGVYANRLSQVFDNTVLVTSQVRCTTRAFAFTMKPSMSDCKPRDLTAGANPDHSWVVIGSGKGQVVLARHSVFGEIELQLHRLGEESGLTLLHLAAPFTNLFTSEVIQYPGRPTLESVLMLPLITGLTFSGNNNSDKPPVLIYPHGGPHAAHTTQYDPYCAALLELGVAILLVNYTGSIGYGQGSIDRLVGHIGDIDVADVQLARDDLVERGVVDKNRIGLFGGSHGGFLTAWLVGKYPDAYKCSVLRNPVINMGSCVAASDIPDWACAENGVNYDFDTPPLITPSIYETLWKASPMSVAQHVKSPVLVLLGAKDQRVPNYEGLNWVIYLRGSGNSNVRCYMYPEVGHSLDSVEAFKLGFEAIAMFLKEFL